MEPIIETRVDGARWRGDIPQNIERRKVGPGLGLLLRGAWTAVAVVGGWSWSARVRARYDP